MTEVKITSLVDAQGLIAKMVQGIGENVKPCATADNGDVCKFALETVGCGLGIYELIRTSDGVECPRRLGSLRITGSNGSAPFHRELDRNHI